MPTCALMSARVPQEARIYSNQNWYQNIAPLEESRVSAFLEGMEKATGSCVVTEHETCAPPREDCVTPDLLIMS